MKQLEKFLLDVFIHCIKVTMVIISYLYTFIAFLYFLIIAYENYIVAKSVELSVTKGDNIGIIDKYRADGYWMVNYLILC